MPNLSVNGQTTVTNSATTTLTVTPVVTANLGAVTVSGPTGPQGATGPQGPAGTGNGSSGVYSPIATAATNLDSNATLTEAQYLREDTVVTVAGRFTANPTSAGVATSFEMSLPVASNIGAVEDVAGVAFCGAVAGMGAAIYGSVANNTAVVSWVASDLNSQTWSYTLTYQVI